MNFKQAAKTFSIVSCSTRDMFALILMKIECETSIHTDDIFMNKKNEISKFVLILKQFECIVYLFNQFL